MDRKKYYNISPWIKWKNKISFLGYLRYLPLKIFKKYIDLLFFHGLQRKIKYLSLDIFDIYH